MRHYFPLHSYLSVLNLVGCWCLTVPLFAHFVDWALIRPVIHNFVILDLLSLIYVSTIFQDSVEAILGFGSV